MKYSEYKKRKKEEESGKKSNQTSSRNYSSFTQYKEGQKFGLDTFESDLQSMGNTINGIYGGWQTAETMQNTRDSVVSMQSRINAYQNYQSKYGGKDLSDLEKGYQTVLDDWDKLTSAYGNYQNADAYNNAVKKAKFDNQFNGLTYDEVQSKKKKYAKDSDEYKYLEEYINYTDLNDFDKALSSISEDSDYKKKLQTNRNQYALDNTFDSYKNYMDKDDFTEKSQYVPSKGKDDAWWQDTSDDTYEFINDVDGARSRILGKHDKYQANAPVYTPSSYVERGLGAMNEEEIAVYNYIYATEGKEQAEQFLTDMEVTLTKRATDKASDSLAEELDGNVPASIAFSLVSPLLNVGGGIYGSVETVSSMLSGEEANPYSVYYGLNNDASTIRDTVGQNIAESTEGMELFGQNVPSFLYQTGMSIADSAVGALSFGKALSPLMGTNAYQQKTKELKEAGASEEEVARGAIASGAFEMLFEYISIDKLLKIKNSDSFKKVVKNSLKQAGIEGSEEVLTEASNIAWDYWNRQDSSEIMKNYQDYLDRGFTEEEAKNKVKWDAIGQVGWAGIGGALSGGGMGSVFSVNNYIDLNATGKQIRSNDRVQEMIDLQDLMEIQGLTPEQSEAYKLYSEYAQKGVNADTISNAQLGNLYQTAFSEAYATTKSKKATQAQKTDANKRLESLDVIATSRPANERARQQRVASLNRGDVTEVTATGNATTIEGIKIDDGNTIVLTSEGEVKAEDMTFTSKDAELLAYAEDMGEEKGSLLLAQYDGKADVDTFANSFELAYSYGESQMGLKKALEKCGNLSISQVTEIYEAGRYEKVNKRQNRLNAITEKYVAKHFYKGTIDESAIDRNNSGKGEVNWKDLGETQKETVEAINLIFTGLGINGKWTTKGKEGGYNGYYSRKDDAIVLDVYAGMDNLNVKDMNLAIVSTASHELTHWMETKAPSTFAKLKDHVFESLAEKDGLSDVDRIENEKNRIKEQMIKNNRKVVEVTDEYAISEIVARACEDMLAMSDMSNEALSRLSEKERKTIFTKVKEILQDMIDYISEILGQFKSQSKEAVKLRENQDRLKEQLKLWEQAMKEAVAVNQSLQVEGVTGEEAINAVTENVGVTVDLETESAHPSEQFSERTWTESEYVQNRSKAIDQLSKALGVSKEEAGRYIDDINSVARLIADDRARLDYEPNLDEHATVVKPNSEYTWSVDMSTLCAKRLLFTGTFDEIQRQLPNTALDSDDIVNIRAMMKEAKHEVACGICYVESTRREIGTITNDFIERYKIAQKTGKPITRLNSSGKEVELVEKGTKAKFYAEKGYTPTLAELNTTDIDLVKRDHPAVYGAYLSYMNARGQAKPKLLETRAEYKGEILRHFKAKSAVKARNDAGGLRLQSFSDFETPHLIDMMQIITDMSRVGLKSQAYTKVANFAEAFGDTGVKINLSLIAKDSGLDADGNLIFDDVEGINHEDAFRIRDKYSKNVGTILVGKNDAHIIRAMADPRIDYIIPFHKSSWKESLYDALGLTGYDDYTASQNEKPIDKTRKIKNFDPSEYWDFSKSGEENAQIYLEKCKEDGRVPKFPQFQGYEGYWKLLIDFKMYDNDGVGSPQTTVTPNFNMEECNRILNEYKGGHRNFPVAKDVVKKFVSEYKKNHPQEQYSDREVRTLTNEDYDKLKSHFGTTTNYNVAGYMLKDGTMLDFSGKHWGNPVPTSREVDHRDVWDVWENNDFDGTDEMVNMISNGNIRLMPENGGINLAFAPTTKQREALEKYINKFRGEVVVDIDRIGGDTIKSFTYDRGTSAKKIFDDIDNYFRGGRQSELMMFHTMYSDREIVGESGKNYGMGVYLDSTLLADLNEDERKQMVKLFVTTELAGNHFTAYDSGNNAIDVMIANKNASIVNKKKKKVQVIGELYKKNNNLHVKQEAIVLADEIIANAKYDSSKTPDYSHGWLDNYGQNDWEYWKVNIQEKDGTVWEATLNIANSVNGEKILYDIDPIKKVEGAVKSASNSTNDSVLQDSDGSQVKFSDRDNVSVYDAMGETDRLIDENKRLSEDIATLKRTISADEVNIKRFRSLADYLKKLAGSQYDRETLGDELKELYTYIQTTDNLQWNNVMAKAYDTARRMMNLNPNVSMNYFREVMADIRKDKVTLSADQRAEAEKMFGSYGDFHKAMFGRVNIVTGGTSLEQMWKEWSQKYPAIFKADLSAVEQVEALVDITNALKSSSSMMGEYEREEAIRHLATEIYNQFWNVASDFSDAVREAKVSHRKLMEDLRKEYEERQKEKTLHPVGETALKYEKLLRKMMQKDKAEIKRAKELGKKRMDEYKDRLEKNAKIKSITAKALTLNQWLTKNSKDEHIPEVMKAPVVYLLNAIDFSSKQLLGMRGGSNAGMATKRDISLSKALEQVHDMVQKINSAQIGEDEITEIYGTFADFPAGFADDIRDLSSIVNDVMRTVGDNAHVLNQMSLEELETLDRIITIIKATATKMNKFLAIRHAEGVANLSQQSINYMDSLGKGKTHEGIRGKVDKLLDWGNALPYYTFKRFGEGGQKVYEALQNGWDTFAFHVKEIIDYADSVYTSKEVKEWSETVKEFDILEPATDEEKASADYEPTYQKVKMSVPQIMSLYCLQKREQAKSHLMGGGMRISDIETKKGIVTQSEGVILTHSEIDMIVESLTDRQRAVADELQKFMNTTCTDWGNEVSMLRFGFKAFGEENYFPIQSDKNNLAVNDETEQNNSLFRLLNMSFTKGTIKKANNRIVISDIFDVFAQHTSDMAKYNALALPVLDSFKWYNYKEKIKKGDTAFTTKSLKQSMENAFSKDAQNYFVTFLKDINGEQSAGRDVVGGGFFTNAKLASVGFNMRVVALQPTSYVRASAVIDNKYLAKAFIHKPKIAMAEKHCGIALWKSLGFYDINIQNSVTDMIKGNQTVKDKIADASMKGAEIADKVTWGYLWNACELEIRDKRKDLRVGSKEFYEAIGKRLREIIYSTQVVDSTMTRSHMMRSKDGKDKMLTAFMSEPTLAYNMLQDCYFDWKLTERQTGSKQTAFKKHGKKMARVITAYTVTNMICALVESGFDIFRDDDDELTPEEFIELYLKNFVSDMSILNKIPYAKEVVSMLQGYSSSRTDTQWMQYMTYTITGIGKLIAGEGNAYTTAKNAMRGFSQMTGLPLYNAWRDMTALLDKTELLSAEELEEIFNDTIGSIFPSLKSK